MGLQMSLFCWSHKTFGNYSKERNICTYLFLFQYQIVTWKYEWVTGDQTSQTDHIIMHPPPTNFSTKGNQVFSITCDASDIQRCIIQDEESSSVCRGLQAHWNGGWESTALGTECIICLQWKEHACAPMDLTQCENYFFYITYIIAEIRN